jgi:hypothetical protein
MDIYTYLSKVQDDPTAWRTSIQLSVCVIALSFVQFLTVLWVHTALYLLVQSNVVYLPAFAVIFVRYRSVSIINHSPDEHHDSIKRA